MTDGFRAWKVNDNKRDEFIQLMDDFFDKLPMYAHTTNPLGYESFDDPIIKFNNFDMLSKKNQDYFSLKMESLGKEITEIFID